MPAPQRSGPLDGAALERFAISYVGRYATTRAKLAGYLTRKIRDRGWSGEGAPPIDAVVERCVAAGYVDDAAFARSRSDALTRRGYGDRRISASLAVAGIDRDLAAQFAHDEAEAFAAAESFARRRRIGPFAAEDGDVATRRRAFAAMLRAGHDFALAKRFANALPGAVPERDE